MLTKFLGASWELKLGAILMALGGVVQALADSGVLAATPIGKYIVLGGAIYVALRGKSQKSTTSVSGENVRSQ